MKYVVCWPDGCEFSKPLSLEVATNVKNIASKVWCVRFYLKRVNQG